MASMVGLMGAPRSRTPNETGARDIAGALYPNLDAVAWIPSDDADVFRLSFTSDREPRILKMATHGIRAVWREIGAFLAMRRLGINDRARALEVAHWLGDCTRRIESLDWRQVPRANSPQRSAAIGVDWRQPQYGQLLARSDCPAWARTFIEQVSGRLSRPDAFDSFGGWGGELLRARDGRFVLIDWPGLGAAPRGSLAALALEILLRFGAADPAPLVGRFLAGWLPAGLDQSRLCCQPRVAKSRTAPGRSRGTPGQM